jgi:hypothetical protein
MKESVGKIFIGITSFVIDREKLIEMTVEKTLPTRYEPVGAV